MELHSFRCLKCSYFYILLYYGTQYKNLYKLYQWNMRLQRNILLSKEWVCLLLTPILPLSPRSTPYLPTQEEIKVETLRNKLLSSYWFFLICVWNSVKELACYIHGGDPGDWGYFGSFGTGATGSCEPSCGY